MFDRLDDILIRYQQVMEELNDPDVVNDQPRFRKLMKEQNDLAPIVEKYTEYKQEKQNVEDSLELLEMENDEEMRELAKEEMAESKKRIGEIEQELEDSPYSEGTGGREECYRGNSCRCRRR